MLSGLTSWLVSWLPSRLFDLVNTDAHTHTSCLSGSKKEEKRRELGMQTDREKEEGKTRKRDVILGGDSQEKTARQVRKQQVEN